MGNSLKTFPVAELTTSFQTLYTVPAATTFTCGMLHVSNNTGSAVTVRICLVPDGGSALAANALIWDLQVEPNSVFELLKGDSWPALSLLRALAGSNSAITVKMSGVETL